MKTSQREANIHPTPIDIWYLVSISKAFPSPSPPTNIFLDTNPIVDTVT